MISAEGDTLIVDGLVEMEGNVEFDCNLQALEVQGSDGDLDIHGDLSSHDGVKVSDGSLRISGSMSAHEVDIDKHLEVRGGRNCFDT